MNYLITGLGNIGETYHNTRHNIGFITLDSLASAHESSFEEVSYGSLAKAKYKGRQLYLLKPSTYMNLSGKAVRYWLQKLKIPISQSLVIVDDIHIELATLRLSQKGGSGGHNGLKSIEEAIEKRQYPRLRFGVGKNFLPGEQAHYVLGEFSQEEALQVAPAITQAKEIVHAFCFKGLNLAMNHYNVKKKPARLSSNESDKA